jgi:DNA-binding NtrC family response regulator
MAKTARGNVLLVDDDRDLAETLVAALKRHGFHSEWKPSARAALAVLGDSTWDVVVSDIHMTGMSGLDLCQQVVANRPDLPVVLITAFGNLESAVAAIRAGAYDFVTKPFQIEVLAAALERAVQHRTRRDEAASKRPSGERPPGQHDMIGDSLAMRRVFELVDRVSETEATVLVSGKSGTGKELVARALHRRGKRSGGPFVAVNCAAIPEPLLESELFGHVKGAFTDARTARRGLFLEAHGGTIFLDEIGELPLSVQPKLLRALQEKKVRPVGGDREESYDARLVTATNRDLEAEVAQGRFREDLFYRINVVRIDIPPLRQRGNDVLLIAQHFLDRVAAQLEKRVTGLSQAAAARLLAYPWPGNVRELSSCIERAVAMATAAEVAVDDLPDKIRDHGVDFAAEGTPTGAPVGDDPGELLSIEELERRHILRVLKAVGGSKVAAAAVLGVDRSTLYRKLDHFGSGGTGVA